MSEWGIALIAAGSAILGSITTGFFAWKAGHRQAAAAETAGQAQAAALISTVQATLDEQRRARALDHRREVYSQLIDICNRRRHAVGPDGDETAVSPYDVEAAFSRVTLEGPADVVQAAREFVRGAEGFSDFWDTEDDFINAARRALNML